MKLIKLTETHYIIVDDSEIQEWFIVNGTHGYSPPMQYSVMFPKDKFPNGHKCDKELISLLSVTHSTKPLLYDEDGSYYPMNVIAISVEEVEEAIYGYDVEKMADSYSKQFNGDYADNHTENIANAGFIEGFKAHAELAKDKLFTIEDMKKCAKAMCAFECGYDDILFDSFIKSLSPTEWEVEFDENGKLKLK